MGARLDLTTAPQETEALLRLLFDRERELDRQRHRLALALAHIPGHGVLMLDSTGRVDEWNPSLGRLLGLQADAAIGRPLPELVATEALGPGDPLPPTAASAPADFQALRDAAARHGGGPLHLPWRRADGSGVVWGDCMLSPLVEAGGHVSGYVAVIRDVTDEHHQRLQREAEALTDPLTGLCNRRGLERRALEPAAATPGPEGGARGAGVAGPPAWITLEIDHFQRVNGTHGRDGGDAVLKAVAVALRGAARAGDTLARVDGEAFVLHLPAANELIARRVAERLRLHLQSLAIDAGRHKVHITASFGVALQAAGETWAQALERAEAARELARHQGHNRVQLAPARLD